MTTTKACISGCTIRGSHLTTCETRDAKIDPCTGCQPRPAEFGQLCAFCWQRLNSDVVDAPGLVRHLRFLAEPDAGRKPAGDGRSMGDPAWGSILSAAIGAADEIHANLASWALLILEEHPNGSRMAGPDPRGAWLTQYGSTVGVCRAEATERMVKWLLPLLPWCSEQEWAGEMRRELSSLIATTKARWPMEDTKTRAIAGTPCVRCHQLSLNYTPPSWFKAPFVVACGNPECGRVFSEDEWERLVGLLEIAEKRAG